LEKLATAGDDLIGVPRMVLDSLDSANAARMLAEPYKIRMYARLLREEAEILAELGRESSFPRERSAELVIEATRLKGGVKAEDKLELLALGEVELSERYAAEAAAIMKT